MLSFKTYFNPFGTDSGMYLLTLVYILLRIEMFAIVIMDISINICVMRASHFFGK